jgi:dTMP kinase
MENFFAFEGIDGSGKSTQIRLLKEFFERQGKTVRTVREPGGTLVSEAVREILLAPAHKGKMCDTAELLLYAAARAQLVREVVEPALLRGEVVLADRFFLSTIAYQGYGRGISIDEIRRITDIACGSCKPALHIVLDVPVGAGRKRQAERKGIPDRLESEGNAFFERVRQGYLAYAQEHPEECVVVDATRSVEEVFEAVLRPLTQTRAG